MKTPTSIVLVFLVGMTSMASSQPTSSKDPVKGISVWKGTPMDGVVEDLRKECSQDKNDVACMKYKVLNLLDQVFRKDSFQVSEGVSVVRNSAAEEKNESGVESRGQKGLLDQVQSYLEKHDVIVQLPWDSSLTVSARNIDDDELSLKLNFPQDKEQGRAVEEGRRSKLRKIIIPILVFVLLKAITLIPLFIGVLGLKAWNALQLSFFSFVISVALAIFQLCKKLASDTGHPQVAAHGPWDSYNSYSAAARSFEPHTLAYNAYAPTS